MVRPVCVTSYSRFRKMAPLFERVFKAVLLMWFSSLLVVVVSFGTVFICVCRYLLSWVMVAG